MNDSITVGKACQLCRYRKVKCDRSPEKNTCSLCEKLGLDCQRQSKPKKIHANKRRKRRHTKHPIEFRNSFDPSLYWPELEHAGSAKGGDKEARRRRGSASSAPCLTLANENAPGRNREDLVGEERRCHGQNLSSWDYDGSSAVVDVIQGGIVDEVSAQKCFRLFEDDLNQYCPVISPPLGSLDLLRRKHPELLLAILAVSSDRIIPTRQPELLNRAYLTVARLAISGTLLSLQLAQAFQVLLFFRPPNKVVVPVQTMQAVLTQVRPAYPVSDLAILDWDYCLLVAQYLAL